MGKTTEDFRRFYFSHARGKVRSALREKIIKACYVKTYTIDNWLNGNASVPPLAQEKIEEIAGYEIFEKEPRVSEADF